MGPHAEKARQLAVNATVSGSIRRIYSSHDSFAVDNCTFGQFVEGGDNIDFHSSTTSIPVPAGSYLEGPFTQLHTSAHVSVVYYSGELTVS